MTESPTRKKYTREEAADSFTRLLEESVSFLANDTSHLQAS